MPHSPDAVLSILTKGGITAFFGVPDAITGGTTLALTRELLAGLGDLLSQRKDDLDDAFGQASECQ